MNPTCAFIKFKGHNIFEMGLCAYGQNYVNSGYLTSHCYDGEAGTRIHHGVSLQDILIFQLKVTCVVLVHNGTKLNGKRNELAD